MYPKIFCLTLLTAICWTGCGETRDYQALAMLYSEPFPSLSRTLSVESETPLAQGLRAYQAQDYPKATSLLAQVPRESEEFLISRYYLGLSLFALEQYAGATEALREASAHEDWKWREPSQWYLGLSLLAQGLPDPACAWLDPDNYHPGTWYKPKADELHHRVCP